MKKGIIPPPEESPKTADEIALERWDCYHDLRRRFPETVGQVDINAIDFDSYFKGLNIPGEPVDRREVSFMQKYLDMFMSLSTIAKVVICGAALTVVALSITIGIRIITPAIPEIPVEISVVPSKSQKKADTEFKRERFDKVKEPEFGFTRQPSNKTEAETPKQ